MVLTAIGLSTLIIILSINYRILLRTVAFRAFILGIAAILAAFLFNSNYKFETILLICSLAMADLTIIIFSYTSKPKIVD